MEPMPSEQNGIFTISGVIITKAGHNVHPTQPKHESSVLIANSREREGESTMDIREDPWK